MIKLYNAVEISFQNYQFILIQLWICNVKKLICKLMHIDYEMIML